jgi:hypothetical protein
MQREIGGREVLQPPPKGPIDRAKVKPKVLFEQKVANYHELSHSISAILQS